MSPTRRTFLAGLSAMAVAPACWRLRLDDTAPGTTAHSRRPPEQRRRTRRPSRRRSPTSTARPRSRRRPHAGRLRRAHRPGRPAGAGDRARRRHEVVRRRTRLHLPVGRPTRSATPSCPTCSRTPTAIQIEKVAALAPDLIVGQYSGMTEKEYELLSKIAPTVAQSGDYADYGTPWDEAALRIGTAVGPAGADAGRSSTTSRRRSPQAAADHPEFDGQHRRRGHAVRGLVRLRTRGPAVAGCSWTSASPSPRSLAERRRRVRHLDQRRADRATSARSTSPCGSTSRPTRRSRRVRQTTTARRGPLVRHQRRHGDYYVAHSFVTPLSIPYVLERYVPQLAAAVDGDPDDGAAGRQRA